tara:strand:+ start:10674 stop:11555 length:882 start_codon:yes stop_codon:yes gene_type:complete
MSLEIPVSYVQQFKDNFIILSQQKGSKLRKGVRTDPDFLQGKAGYYERIGSTTAQLRTSRHQDTPQVNTPHSRRRVTMNDYNWADLIDNPDRIRMLADPEGSYAINAAYALGRAQDDEIITALTGSAYSMDEDDAATAVVLPSAQKVAVGTTGLTKAKLLSALEVLRGNDVDLDDPMNRMYMGISAKQLSDLLIVTEVTSSDYNTVKALVEGNVQSWMGITFILSERLNSTGSTTRLCPLWCESGMGLAMGEEIIVRVSERADKSYSTQVYLEQAVGATRIEDEKVVEIACAE